MKYYSCVYSNVLVQWVICYSLEKQEVSTKVDMQEIDN